MSSDQYFVYPWSAFRPKSKAPHNPLLVAADLGCALLVVTNEKTDEKMHLVEIGRYCFPTLLVWMLEDNSLHIVTLPEESPDYAGP